MLACYLEDEEPGDADKDDDQDEKDGQEEGEDELCVVLRNLRNLAGLCSRGLHTS